jgi:hypothetical protein
MNKDGMITVTNRSEKELDLLGDFTWSPFNVVNMEF